jgi:flagellar motor switch protein FliN/FliY
MLYKKAKEIEMQIVSDENVVDLDHLIEVSDKLNKLRVSLGEKEGFSKEDVINMQIGSVIELNRKSHERIDLFVNEKLVAKGSVVVIEENFGVVIEEILNDDNTAV